MEKDKYNTAAPRKMRSSRVKCAALLQRRSQGDLKAIDDLYEECSYLLEISANKRYGVLSFMTKDEAMSIANKAFMDAVRLYTPEKGHFPTFLWAKLQYAFLAAAESAHKTYRRKMELLGEDLEDAGFYSLREKDFAGQINDSIDIAQALVKIPYRQARIVRLYYGIGEKPLSIDDIAELLGVHESTIRVEKARGLKALRNLMEGYE